MIIGHIDMIKLKEMAKKLPDIPNNIRIHDTGMKKSGEIKRLFSVNIKKQKSDDKPVGFWYGFGNSWLEWCQSEMPHWIGGLLYEIIIPSNKNILVMKTPKELKQFTEKYYDRDAMSNEGAKKWYIDWNRVALEYEGIEINPYVYQMRFKLGWYYSWDVGSGCIWNTKGCKVKKIGKNLRLSKGIKL